MASAPCWLVRSAISFHVVEKTRTKLIVTDPPPRGQRMKMPLTSFTFLHGDASVNMSAMSFLSLYAKYAGIFEKKKPTLLSWPICILIDFFVRPSTTYTSRTGRFVVSFFHLSQPVSPIIMEASLQK